jgi:hypothetical protein
VAYGHLEYEPINPKGALEVVGTRTMKGREFCLNRKDHTRVTSRTPPIVSHAGATTAQLERATCKYSYNGGALTAKQDQSFSRAAFQPSSSVAASGNFVCSRAPSTIPFINADRMWRSS